MTATVFVDTNVLIYALDAANLKKQEAARVWRTELWKSGRGRISYQVLQEFYAKVTRTWPGARREARAEVRDLLAWHPVAVDDRVLERAWTIQDRYQLSFLGLFDRGRGSLGFLPVPPNRGLAGEPRPGRRLGD